MKNAEVNSLKVVCCIRATRASTLAKLQRNGYELIPHLFRLTQLLAAISHSQNLDMRGCYFRSDEEVMTAVEEWVNGEDPDSFRSGLMALEHRLSKCTTL